jgi:two-component system, cell cycle response regulator DivK
VEKLMASGALIIQEGATADPRLAKLLEKRFDSVRAVSTPSEALEVAMEMRPDLVITPFPAVTRSGELICTVLRGDPRTSGCAILAYSDWCWARTRDKARQAGCDAFVPATASEDELMAAIDAVLPANGRAPNPPNPFLGPEAKSRTA